MANPTPPGKNRHLAIFRVASYAFCAPAHTISAITGVPPWTRIPKTPPSILGAVNHRGQVVVVVSLRHKLGQKPRPTSGQSQLIIAELNTGLTGFMVDEVEDVRLPVDMQRHPLSADGGIDIFDAYLVDGERILLHTTFQKLYDARDTPPLDADLKAHLRQAEEQLNVIGAAAATRKTATAAGSTNRESQPATEPVSAVTKTPESVRAVKSVIHRAEQTLPPTDELTSQPPIKPGAAPAESAAGPVRPELTPRYSGRPPWYRYAIVAALLLAMTVALGAGVWLVRHQSGRRSPQPSGISVSKPEEPTAQSSGTGQAETPKKPSPQETTTGPAISAEESESAPRANVPVMTAANELSAGQATDIKNQAPESPAPPAEMRKPEVRPPHTSAAPDTPASEEVLRVETESFTLTVERPGDSVATPSSPMTAGPLPAATEEIRHVVVSGDTLWDIAAHYLGDPFQYPELARLSRIRNPDLIYPNDVIRIMRRSPGSKSTTP